MCGRSLADTLAVAYAGRVAHAPQAALRYLTGAGLLRLDDGAGQVSPQVSLWGRPERAAPEVAAWWNGVAGHVLDYDDVTVPMRGHPSVVLWPALLALAEARGLPGARLAASFVVGMEVICKLSRGIAFDHYAHGWHATASIGVLGGAVACGHLLGLDEARLVNALGLAVAQAAGSRENVGTEGKSFQAGHACGAAVRAACLAEAGFEAGERALDGRHGYLALYAGGCSVDALLDDLGAAPLEIERSGLDVKQYPMCYATHRALDALLALRRDHGLTLSGVQRVSVTASRDALLPLVHPRPRSGLEGKFSLAYAMAAALADGAITLASFTDAAVQRPDVQAFFDRVTWTDGAGPTTPRWAMVTLDLQDGRQVSRTVQVLHGSAQDPLSDDELAAKLQDCLRWGGMPDDDAGERLLQRCCGLPAGSVRDLLDSLN